MPSKLGRFLLVCVGLLAWALMIGLALFIAWAIVEHFVFTHRRC